MLIRQTDYLSIKLSSKLGVLWPFFEPKSKSYFIETTAIFYEFQLPYIKPKIPEKKNR